MVDVTGFGLKLGNTNLLSLPTRPQSGGAYSCNTGHPKIVQRIGDDFYSLSCMEPQGPNQACVITVRLSYQAN